MNALCSPKSLVGRPTPRALLCLYQYLGLTLALGLGACGGNRVGSDDAIPETTTQPRLALVEYGRLADVYGLQTTANGTTIALHRRDVLIGGDIDDERPADSGIRDSEIRYDFFGADPDTLQPRLLIPREIGSQQFEEAVSALDDNCRSVTAMLSGQAATGTPFSVVPRNAALRLSFSAALGVGDDFFVVRDAAGQVTGLRNTEAVQLLRIVGNPGQSAAFVPMPVRVIVRDRQLLLDPVLLGTEGLQYQTGNNAAGLPESPDNFGANIRIAIALEGPLAIPGLRESPETGLTGNNNSGRRSIVRDFRSGNQNDVSADITRGFVRDPLPLRMVGEIPLYLERVDDVNAFTQEVTVFKNGVSHEIDRGDVLRFLGECSGRQIGSAEVVADPADDRDDPSVQHVRVRIRRLPDLACIDPRDLPGYPTAATPSIERETWLVQNAPRVVCIAEFTAGDADGRDDPRNFLTFTPSPLELGGYVPELNEFVSPFAGAVVRFTKPVDMASVRWADTFFFAMRDLTSQASIDAFVTERGIDPQVFDVAKYRTPFLVTSRVFDEDGSQTSLRLQPSAGFYLDETMRDPTTTVDFRYFLHLISDSDDGGIKDLAGNRLDLQGTTADRANSVVIPFTLDTRKSNGEPVFADNIAISLVRRMAARDEDENPSYFRPEEVQSPGGTPSAATFPLDDLFGAFLYLDNRLEARPTTRMRVIADDLNQSPVQQQTARALPQNPLGWCPQTVFDPGGGLATDDQRTSNSSTNLTAGPIQNPLNPFGCRLQTLWRDVDLSLSRDNPFDFNLDVEQMYWAPFRSANLQFDRFDQVSLWLAHAEFRPAPCVGDFSALPSLPESGLRAEFEQNILWNPQPIGSGQAIESQAPRRAAYVNAPLRVDPADVVLEPNGVNRYLPLPTFQQPYFVYRDETVVEQGGDAGLGSDLTTTPGGTVGQTYAPYILSPFAMGQGRRWVDQGGAPQFVRSYWNEARNYQLGSPSTRDFYTGGLSAAIAQPLLADFWTLYDSSELPAGAGFFAFGTNGWQTALTVQSDPRPRFRVFSAGRPGAAPQGQLAMGPNDPGWTRAVGGWGPNPGGAGPWVVVPPPPPSFPAGPDIKGDGTLYWVMLDLLKRQTVVTSGFVDLYNPHRVPEGLPDVRLGPYYLQSGEPSPPTDVLPTFAYEFDPPPNRLPPGTSIVPQFRAAGAVDETPWYWQRWIDTPNALWPTPTAADPSLTPQSRAQLRPTADNFALDPYKAGDAHLRKWDTRPLPGTTQARNWWTYLYNRTVTSYVEDPNDLMDPAFAASFAGPGESFTTRDVRYVNWRFVMSNNTEANPPIAPSIETFALSYRFQRQ